MNHEEYYYDTIVSTYKHLSERTKYEYEYCWKNLRNYISGIKIVDTNWQVVQHVIDKIKSPSMQKACFRFWRRMLNFAIQDNLISNNPCNSSIKLKPITHKNKYIYKRDELLNILKTVDNTEFALPVLLECLCGLRHEEYCGLDKKDIYIQNDKWIIISINKAVTYAGTKKILKDPKTKTSTREVLLHPVFYGYLKNNLRYIKTHSSIKDYIDPLAITKKWRKFATSKGIPYTQFGNMRTIYATLSAEACCVDSIVSRSMGHSGNTTKDRNYLSVSLDLLKINATLLASYINPQAFNNGKNLFSNEEALNIQLLLKFRNLIS